MSAERKSRPGILAGVKEFFRKQIVTLKRNPSMIPLLMLVASFLVYSLNLTDMSDTTAKIQGAGMGLCQFCIMLFSLLSMLCMLNSFPRRKKPNIAMIVIMFVMFAVIIYCDTTALLTAVLQSEQRHIRFRGNIHLQFICENTKNRHFLHTLSVFLKTKR